MMMKPYGFLQEDFHSEVLGFLYELISTREPERRMIHYNKIDRYNNIELHKRRYKNLEVRDIEQFIPDLTSKHCEKIFVISYDNILHLCLLLPYRDQLIFMAHSEKHIERFTKFNLEHFALTGLLSTRFMIPFTKDITWNRLGDVADLKVELDNKDMMNHIKSLNLEVLMIMGSFFENNKDLDTLRNIVSTRRYVILVFTTEVTRELHDFVQQHREFVYVALNLHTEQVLFYKDFFNIHYLLFVPPKESNFFKSSWSGSIQFAFDFNLNIIMPHELTETYGINNPSLIAYKTADDILSGISSECVVKDTDKNFQIVRDETFKRNLVVLDIILNKIPTSTLGTYCINSIRDKTDIDKKVEGYHAVFNELIGSQTDRLDNQSVITVDPDDTVFSLTVALLNKSCRMIEFIPDLERARYYKNISIYNNLHRRTTFYYALLSDKNKRNQEGPEEYTLDRLRLEDNIKIIHITAKHLSKFVLGALDTLRKQRPIIIVKDDRQVDSYESEGSLIDLGYTIKQISNFHVYT